MLNGTKAYTSCKDYKTTSERSELIYDQHIKFNDYTWAQGMLTSAATLISRPLLDIACCKLAETSLPT